MKDYYKTLGVDKTSSAEEIKKAFRKMAHQYHPDKTKNDPAAAQKFKEASEAYSVLSDDNKRRQYDTYGAAGPGFNPHGQGGFHGGAGFGGFDFSQFQQAGFGGGQGGVEFDLGDIFGEFFGGGGRRPRKGRNITVDVQISFRDSVFGVEKDITIGKDKIAITIPPGIESGQGLRVPGKGEAGQGGPGDLIVRIWVEEHPTLRKDGHNLVMELPIKATTALGGGAEDIDTLDGRLEIRIPPGTAHGEVLRIKGKGVPYESGSWTGNPRRGDLLVVVRVTMPKKLSKEATRLIDALRKEGI